MSTDVWDNVWSKDLITSDYSLKYLEFIRKKELLLKDNSKVIEVGSGTGQTLSLFSNRHNTTGFDISKNALLLSRLNCDNPVMGNLLKMPFKDECFDFVYNSGVIEHFKEPLNIQAVSEMGRITKKGGHVLIIVPNTTCPWYRIWKYLSLKMKRFEFGYEEDYSIWRLRRTFKESNSNLKIESEFGLQALPPLATNESELISEKKRDKIGKIERIFPTKQYYAYGVGIYARKV